MTAPAKLRFIPDIVEEHYDELQFLWSLRRAALRSPTYRTREFIALDERIEAHAEAMLIIAEQLIDFVEPGLAGDEELPAFAAAFTLLRLGTPDALNRVLEAFRTANGKKLNGLRDALAHGPSRAADAQLMSLFLSASPPVGAAAGEALAFHAAIAPTAKNLERLIRAEEPAARASGWHIAAYCGVSLSPEWYEAGLGDDDPSVKRAALTTAAWNAYPRFAPYCRSLAVEPTPESIEPLTLLASVSPPEEYQTIGAVAAVPAAGPGRYRVVAAFGHPHYVDFLISEMRNPDPAAAAAAGVAFTKLTGRDVESDTRVKVSPDGKSPADDFEAEFQDEVFLPDPELASKHWQELTPRLASSPRICRGMDVSRALSREQFAALDMESRWEYCLRARLYSGWQGTPLVLERYPQRF
jgi:uncharacterized protein (TIGR02270 family)